MLSKVYYNRIEEKTWEKSNHLIGIEKKQCNQLKEKDGFILNIKNRLFFFAFIIIISCLYEIPIDLIQVILIFFFILDVYSTKTNEMIFLFVLFLVFFISFDLICIQTQIVYDDDDDDDSFSHEIFFFLSHISNFFSLLSGSLNMMMMIIQKKISI